MLECIREVTLRCTTPVIHFRHRKHKCDGRIISDIIDTHSDIDPCYW